jgi:hypothetical protein
MKGPYKIWADTEVERIYTKRSKAKKNGLSGVDDLDRDDLTLTLQFRRRYDFYFAGTSSRHFSSLLRKTRVEGDDPFPAFCPTVSKPQSGNDSDGWFPESWSSRLRCQDD